MARLEIEPGAAMVLARLTEAGFSAYVVGGCVRDMLLGKPASDWDICTSALPEETLALFGAERCIATGLKHGTVTVKESGNLYEVTTFRTEGTYSDGRHPDRVDFVKEVQADLARRDFTINAMAYNEREGLIDPFLGREDLLSRRVLRAVGRPDARFEEDALRIMRLFRFAARFGFEIEEETYLAAIRLAGKLSCVSGERIREELMKLLETKAPGGYLPREIVCRIAPGMQEIPQEAYESTLRAVDSLAPDAEIRLAALLFALCAQRGVEAARDVMRRLRCANRTTQRVLTAISGALCEYPQEEDALRICTRRMLGKAGSGAIQDILALSRAVLDDERASRIERLAAYAKEAEEQGLCCCVGQLAVTGGDLMRALGMKPGPRVGRLLSRLLDAVIAQELPNDREALLEAAKEENGEEDA